MVSQTGADGFIAGLRDGGLDPVIGSAPAISTIAGSWPTVPPHWLHLPATIRFPRTNISPSPLGGWVRHSRPPAGWGNDAAPEQAYLAHVRGILGEAQ